MNCDQFITVSSGEISQQQKKKIEKSKLNFHFVKYGL